MSMNAKELLAGRAHEEKDDQEMQDRMAREDLSWGAAFSFMWRLLKRHPLLMTGTITIGILLASLEVLGLSLIFPFITSLSGDGGAGVAGQTKLAFLVPYFEGFDLITKIRLIAVGLILIQVAKGLLKYLGGRLAAYQKILLDRDLMAEVFDQIVDLEMRYINKDKTANLYTLLHQYAGDVTAAARKMLLTVPKAAKGVGYLVAALLISWQLTLIALAMAVVTNKSVGMINKWIRSLSRKGNIHGVRLRHASLEALNGLKVIHLFGREDHAKERFSEQLETYQSYKYRKSSLGAAVSPIYSTLMMSLVASILIVGTFVLNTSAEFWVAMLTMFMVVLFKLLSPTARYAKTKSSLAGKLPSFEEVIDFLEREDKPYLPDGHRTFQRLEQGVRIEDLWFRYEPDEPYVLKGIDLEIPRGKTVALVGASGAGKSTTIDLLARLYDPDRGRITVDGVDLREFEVASWRHGLSVVSQDTFLFNQSVWENIRFGRLDATDEEIEEAARQAGAYEFIQGLPEGFDTPLGDRGVRLSGGQAQRIAIARAILADPEVLLLDEATSSLDTGTERKVQQALDQVSRDRTVVVIAHRLSTVRNADTIVVMEDGEIVERGSHRELLAHQGHYWRYVQMQGLIDDGTDEEPGGREHTPTVVDHAPRIVLRAGSPQALVMRNGDALGEVRIVPVAMDQSVEDAMACTRGDAVFLREGQGVGTVRIGDEVRNGARLFLQKRDGENGGTREKAIKIQAFNGNGH